MLYIILHTKLPCSTL